MPIYKIAEESLEPLPKVKLSELGLDEKKLQALIRDQIEILDELLVIGEEFGDWEGSKRRIDLLAIDKNANLVVIELKRDDSSHMELQALRYAAMVSTMTFEKAVETYKKHLENLDPSTDAQQSLLEFLEWDEPNEDSFAEDVKIILASTSFSKELATAVLWLNDRDLNIRCFHLQPYSDGDQNFLDVQQLIPLTEAEEYQTGVKRAQQERRASRQVRSRRENLKFEQLGIPEGGRLKFIGSREDSSESTEPLEAEIVPSNKVRFKGEVMSLTKATNRALGKPDNNPIYPALYWSYNDRKLKDLYEEFHGQN